MSEQVVTFGKHRTLVGILHRPAIPRVDLPTVVLLNAGILHRVGPNRLYVTIARRLAALGFTVLRFDVWGIGDSQDHDGALDRDKTFVDDTIEALDMLGDRVAARQYLVMGICMGARIGLEVAARDTRVTGLALMEGIYLKSLRYHVRRALAPEKWARVLTGRSHLVKQVRRAVARKLGAEPQKVTTAPTSLKLFPDEGGANTQTKLQMLLERGVQIQLVFRDGNEVSFNYQLRRTGDEIVALGLPPGLEVAFIPFADHTFTPLVSQDLLLRTMSSWCSRHYDVTAAAAA
jgi:pimeloyl-ACP methyl ester carboxylesterase